MPDDPAEQILNGRYRIDSLIAHGGMAEVYLATDLVLTRPVAVKILARRLSTDENFIARFRREAQAAANLNDRNVVAVFDWGEAEGSYFIVMEYVPGRTLAQLIASDAPLIPARISNLGVQMAAGLAAAHRSGLVHRDIKPSNVLVDDGDRVKVTDFGIARGLETLQTQLTQTGTILGTATYLSPEQALGHQLDSRSDIYSLGVVLYEMATGRPPFTGDTAVAIAYQHAHQQVVPPGTVNPDLPGWLSAVIARALAKDPELRYQHAEELRRDLETGGAAATRELTPSVTRGETRGGLWVGLAVAVLIAAAVGSYFGIAGASSGHRSVPPATKGTAPPTSSSTTTSTTTSSTTLPPTTLPTNFVGYAVVAGNGDSALYCPVGVNLGSPGQAGTAGNAHTGSPGAGGLGGTPGCGNSGGGGGPGGDGGAAATGGSGGNGGNGGCPPSTLSQMQSGVFPCDGTGSDGGGGGSGGNAAPAADGGPGGAGGAGGNTHNAKGGDGGNGGNARPGIPGAAGGPGEPGGGPSGTTPGVNGSDGFNA